MVNLKIVLVSDSQDLARDISLVLKVRWPGLSLLSSLETRESTALIHREQPDIVMLVHGTPSVDCFDLISRVRSFSDVPLIVLGQDANAADRLKLLEMGADSWITLSSISMEFITEVNTILRRSSLRNDWNSHFLGGKLAINYPRREVLVSGKKVNLPPILYRILCHLAQNEGRVVSGNELLRRVWGPAYEGEMEILKANIYRLRCKIEQDPARPEIILTERGAGYIILDHETPPPSYKGYSIFFSYAILSILESLHLESFIVA